MNTFFIGDPREMTYEWYLRQPNPMIEWCLTKKKRKNPELIKTIKMPWPVIWKYSIYYKGEDDI